MAHVFARDRALLQLPMTMKFLLNNTHQHIQLIVELALHSSLTSVVKALTVVSTPAHLCVVSGQSNYSSQQNSPYIGRSRVNPNDIRRSIRTSQVSKSRSLLITVESLALTGIQSLCMERKWRYLEPRTTIYNSSGYHLYA